MKSRYQDGRILGVTDCMSHTLVRESGIEAMDVADLMVIGTAVPADQNVQCAAAADVWCCYSLVGFLQLDIGVDVC